ncbi:MAG: exonuclease SbcCD subunit D C-terminal domain-containing protein [Bacteroidaceae bacterium]|nr:exonuclease SbcCD subunit D C-terminal domain-containing protein [Bacteroidaceae bacterium]
MKIIHTSDWHLGQNFYCYDREDEHEFFISQLEDIIREEQPDALVVSGDIYDNIAPSIAALELFVRSVMRLRDACQSCTIVITAGNHDSGNRLNVLRPVWDAHNVKVFGSCQCNDDKTFNPDELIVRIGDKGYVVAVPFFQTMAFPQADVNTPREERQKRFFEKLMGTVAEHNHDYLPIILMAHLAVSGCNLRGHDNGIVGGMEMHTLDKLNTGYDYLALGHIHMPQDIIANHVRYSGSPIPLSFSEDYQHSVTIVEIDRHGDTPHLRHKDIVPLRTVRTIRATSLDDALQELATVGNTEQVYIRIIIDNKESLPANAEQLAREVVEGKEGVRICEVRKDMSKVQVTQTTEAEDIDLTSTDNTFTPMDLAQRHYRKQVQSDLPADLEEMMRKVINEITNN